MIENPNVFDPAVLSFEDCDFLLAHAGDAPVVARRQVPRECNKTVLEWIERFYELQELERAQKVTWKGIAAVKASIQVYLDMRTKWAADEKLGAPAFPSLYAFDSRGKAHFQGPGSDSGRIKTYFNATGERVPFALNLVADGIQGWVPEWVSRKAATQPDAVLEDATKGTIECGICHKTEAYRLDSRTSRAAARSRISKHLRSAEAEKERHSELHTLEFNS